MIQRCAIAVVIGLIGIRPSALQANERRIQQCISAIASQHGLTLRPDQHRNDGQGWIVSGQVGRKRAGCIFDASGERIVRTHVYD